MSEWAGHPHASLRKALSARCRTLGVPVWFINGDTFDSGLDVSNCPAILRSPLLRARLQSACRRSRDQAPIAQAPEYQLVPLLAASLGESSPFAVALVISDRFAGTSFFVDLCRDMELQQDEAQRQLAPFLRHHPLEMDRTVAVIRWTFNDLLKSHRDGFTLEQYGDQLLKSYEQINAFFQMARSINWVGDPAKLMQLVLDQLQHVLPFRWMAIRFRPGGSYAAARFGQTLSGQTILAGVPPLMEMDLNRFADDAFPSFGSMPSTKVLIQGRSALATCAESDVLAEPIVFDGQQIGLLLAGNKTGQDPNLESGEIQFLNATAELLGVFHENACRFSEQRASLLGVLQALTGAIDAKHPYTCGHSRRVALLASMMASALGLGETLGERYHVAGLVHDVGKIGVPEAMLCKPGELTEEEFRAVQRHPEIGYGILKGLPRMEDVLPAVLHHHERWDGTGYPHGLAKDAVPLIARVLALADTFDAMSSDRAYRPGMLRHEVLAEIIRCSGTQFDPELVPRFVGLNFAMYDALLNADRRSIAA